MTDEQVMTAVSAAIECLRIETPTLDFGSVHERTTAHRLAVHLEPRFATWNVDCEYDRDGILRKMLTGIADFNPHRTTDAILPDIVVHRRRQTGRENNLLVIELKKYCVEDIFDRRKLELLTSPYERFQYQLGLYININDGRLDCTWYKDGAQLRA